MYMESFLFSANSNWAQNARVRVDGSDIRKSRSFIRARRVSDSPPCTTFSSPE